MKFSSSINLWLNKYDLRFSLLYDHYSLIYRFKIKFIIIKYDQIMIRNKKKKLNEIK